MTIVDGADVRGDMCIGGREKGNQIHDKQLQAEM